MKILINGKLVDFSECEPNTEVEKKKAPKPGTENLDLAKVHDQGKDFLASANNFNKSGKKSNVNS